MTYPSFYYVQRKLLGMKKLTLLLFAFHAALILNGQGRSVTENLLILDENIGTQMFVQVKAHVGKHLYTGNTFHEHLKEVSYASSIRFGWRTSGKKDWEKALNYPLYGVGVFGGRIGKEQYFGNPIGTYGFFSIPILRRKRHNFNVELAPGVVFNLTPYHVENNPLNDAVGSPLLLFFNFQLGGDLILTQTLDFTYGIDYTHFSNGRVKTPNYGINIAGLNVGLRYNFNPIRKGIQLLDPDFEPTVRPTLDKSPKGPAPESHDINLYVAVGPVMYETSELTGPEYTAWTTYLEYSRRYAHISSYSAGVDFLYDGSVEQDVLTKGNPYSKDDSFYIALHAGHAVYISKFSVEIQLGGYIYKPNNYKGDWYLRTALKYQFDNGLYVQIGLKTKDAGAADWAEFGVGYRLFSSYYRK
jgi:hypothetical protein